MNGPTNTPESEAGFRPWRSAPAGWVAVGALLLAGVPLFLAMPPWCDVTLYQMAARNVLNGGVHYRDIFDTNLPGFVWAMAACKAVFGWNYEALRAVDLCVIGGSVAALCGWVRRGGGNGYTVAWFVAAVALFYPFTSEFSHIQRDPWMLLPAALAARLRLRRVVGESRPTPPAPLPEGKGETETGGSLSASGAPVLNSPFPSGRGAGGGGLLPSSKASSGASRCG